MGSERKRRLNYVNIHWSINRFNWISVFTAGATDVNLSKTVGSCQVYLLFVLCGFMVLIKGIWSPIVLSVAVHYVPDVRTTKHSDDAVLLLAIVLTLPLFLSQDLHGLR